VAGSAAALYYAQAGLTLSHYDARAHLVIARRILDSLMPGWQQIGAVWLPLPHVLNMLPVQVDTWYRSGASGTAISVLGLAVGAGSLAWFLLRRTGSVPAAAAGAVLLLVNPNLLYLQSTPMTEPLLFGMLLLAVALTADWLDRGAGGWPRAAGLAMAGACMTRYEAWPIGSALITLALAVLIRRGMTPFNAARACARLAAYPAVAILLFLAHSRWTVGSWFISSGFYVPENEALGHPMMAWEQVREGLDRMAGTATVWPAVAALALTVWTFLRSKPRASMLVVLSLGAAAALPWFAYLQGHPFRVRYSLPLVVACVAVTATGISLLPRRTSLGASVVVLLLVVWQVSPLDRSAPLVVESQRDRNNRIGRETVTAFLVEHRDGRPIMMSMGSLAHYMHDLSRAEFNVRDFLHEGNGEIWVAAMEYGPRGHVGWVAIEERAEGGDALFLRSKQWTGFLGGFERVAEGGGVALYRAEVRTPGGPDVR
jgi:hypothetical protein